MSYSPLGQTALVHLGPTGDLFAWVLDGASLTTVAEVDRAHDDDPALFPRNELRIRTRISATVVGQLRGWAVVEDRDVAAAVRAVLTATGDEAPLAAALDGA